MQGRPLTRSREVVLTLLYQLHLSLQLDGCFFHPLRVLKYFSDLVLVKRVHIDVEVFALPLLRALLILNSYPSYHLLNGCLSSFFVGLLILASLHY